MESSSAILLISCKDTKGIIAKVSNFIYANNGNIEYADQHIDSATNTFFMRIKWSLENFKIKREKIAQEFKPLAESFRMNWQLYFTDEVIRAAIFVSRHLHCLYDILLRHQENQLKCQIPVIISNYPFAKKIADNFHIKFWEFPITRENREKQEEKEIALLKEEKIDFIILARYDRILTQKIVGAFPNRIINIHHSFLPAFVGKNPYQQAYRRGVKIIGATSHYVTEELDAGPIIEQDTVRISHRDSLQDLRRKGEDLEKVVLSRAVRWHIERKILVYDNKTVVFD